MKVVQAAPWTFTTFGTIDLGTDDHGFFGISGGDLAGLFYSNVITLNPLLYENQYFNSTQLRCESNLLGLATNTITINGIALTFSWDLSKPNNGESLLRNSLTQGTYCADRISQSQTGVNVNGQSFSTKNFITSSVNAFNLDLSFNQVWAYHIQNGDFGQTTAISINADGEQDFLFVGTPNFISINDFISINAVSEPVTYGMNELST